jgi:integrase
MSSIIKVKGKWRAQVRRANHSPQTRTFESKRDALEWARKLEAGIDAGALRPATATLRLREVIDAYRQFRDDGGRPIEPSTNTRYMLDHLVEDLGGERIAALTPERLVRWARDRRDAGAGPYTVNMELSALGTALRHVGSFKNWQFADVVGLARPLLLHLQLIGGGNRRTRRATDDELEAVLAWCQARDPMVADALRVAAITGLRRSELVDKLRWSDIDDGRRAALIRQRKHPRRVQARDEWVPLLGDAWSIVQRQQRLDDRVFPMSREKLTDTFTAATRALSIPDLRLHDLRHLAATRLQELGFDESERMAITGHRNVGIHQRYVHPSPEHLHQKFEQATRKGRAKLRAVK